MLTAVYDTGRSTDVMEIQKDAQYLKEEMAGCIYRHFKGELYIVTDVIVNSESLEIEVIYKDFTPSQLTWSRDLKQFFSGVNTTKYPDALQRVRFKKSWKKRGDRTMSNPKHDWYGHAVKQVKKYPDKLIAENTAQSALWMYAINKAIKQTEGMDNGEDRMKAVQLVYFEDRYTIAGAANKLGYAEMTIRRWLSAFANLAGKYAGY